MNVDEAIEEKLSSPVKVSVFGAARQGNVVSRLSALANSSVGSYH